MIEKLNDNPLIHRICVPLPENPLKLLNSYVIQDGGETMIIDTGFNRPECEEALLAGLEELGVEFGEISEVTDPSKFKVVLTHLHSDHTGLVGKLIERGGTVYMSSVDRWLLAANGRWEASEKMFVKYGYPESEIVNQRNNQALAFSPPKVFPAVEINDGDILRVGNVELECIHVPGHTPGQMVLYIRSSKILFSADHVLFDITPNISVWGDDDHSLENYIESLQLVRRMDIDRTFPGHREFAGNIYDRIDGIMEHHRIRLNEILEAADANRTFTIYEIAGRVSWSARGRKFEDFAPTQKWFAMGETLSHIFWLIHHGYVELGPDCRVIVKKNHVDVIPFGHINVNDHLYS